ncbi:hypothetical protein MBLNU230_g7702t1 [Neophaeotheca triangularis]
MSAAATVFSTSSSFPVELGNGIPGVNSGGDRKARWNSIRYNHKPRSRNGKELGGRIKPGKDGDAVLSLRERGGGDGDGVFWYRGQGRQEEDNYVLVLKGEGDGREMVLEKLGGGYTFNLFREPEERDAGKLEQKHPHISLHEQEQGGACAIADEGADDNGEPDDSNPFDFRHFLKSQPQAPARTTGSSINTPQSTAARPAQKPPQLAKRQQQQQVQPAQKKRKPALSAQTTTTASTKQSTASPAPKRAKATSPQPTQTSNQDVPRVHLDRKASLRRPSVPELDTNTSNNTNDEDNGELILENDTPTTEKPAANRNNATSLALANGNNGGLAPKRVPMSLHTAVSSPSGSARLHSASPMMNAQHHNRCKRVEEGEEFELGGEDDDADDDEGEVGDGGVGHGEDDDDDADVEDLELPSPAAVHRPSSSRAQVVEQGREGEGNVEGEGEGEGDEDDDLERQMMMAMAEEGDEGLAEESEESEEE